MTIKGRIEDTKNKVVKIQTLENFLDKSREMQSEALVTAQESLVVAPSHPPAFLGM